MDDSVSPGAAGGLERLTPTQADVCRTALEMLTPGRVVVLDHTGSPPAPGLGSTTIMKEMRRITGGEYVDVGDVLEITRLRHPRFYELSTFEVIRKALERAEVLYLDRPPFGGHDYYNRNGVGASVLRYVSEIAEREGKRVVVVGAGASGAVSVRVPDLTMQDYAHIFRSLLGVEAVRDVDFFRVFEFASKLNGHQLSRICETLKAKGIDRPTTRDIAEISAVLMGASINLGEVEALSFSSLIGFEPILRRLDQAVLLPLREPELARDMGLEAKRGVLLYGPPGTGKTSVGRALAHRMQGRFFMIDGQHNQELKGCFYKSTAAVFEMAMRSSPSVIFIDDADVILSDPEMQQWGRFLLTKLDGLHSQSAARVCVMMTAMNLKDMPPALLRSGRLEVWLETTLPDAGMRAEMLRTHLARVPIDEDPGDLTDLADLTEGFTPADIRALVHDGAGYLVFDRARGNPDQPFPAYLARAAQEMRAHKALAAMATGRRGR